MDYLWSGMILLGIVYAAFHGTLPELTDAVLDAAKEAVTLCITMTGVMSFWSGLMKIAEKSGIIDGLTRKLMPFLHVMFPQIPKHHKANKYIATNIIANMFGLGWAATPAGLEAMKALAELEEERENTGVLNKKKNKECRASKEMCTFLIINISSLQLIPVNIIAYRRQYGSSMPTAIIGPALLATFCSTLTALVFCKIIDKSITK